MTRSGMTVWSTGVVCPDIMITTQCNVDNVTIPSIDNTKHHDSHSIFLNKLENISNIIGYLKLYGSSFAAGIHGK